MPRNVFEQKAGRSVLNKHHSMEGALRTLYPNHPWQSLRFFDGVGVTKANNKYWDNPLNQKEFLESVGKDLGFQQAGISLGQCID